MDAIVKCNKIPDSAVHFGRRSCFVPGKVLIDWAPRRRRRSFVPFVLPLLLLFPVACAAQSWGITTGIITDQYA